jgi:galactokinase
MAPNITPAIQPSAGTPKGKDMDVFREYEREFEGKPACICRAPGRVNLIGEHVDYNDGPVLPAAIDREVNIAAGENPDGMVRLFALDLGEKVTFGLERLEVKVDIDGSPLPAWALYPAGVAWALMKAGLEVKGLNACYTSNVPIGAGLSSSAAIEVGFGVTWQTLAGWEIELLELAQICQRAENEYVGLSCGLMDQFASACGVEGHALYFDTRSLEYQPAPLPEGVNIVIADSGVRRSLTSSAYNERRASCEKAVELLREYLPDIESLRDVSPVEFAAYKEYLPEIERKRAEHIVKEIARVQSALSALKRSDDLAFGALMYSSHASLRDLYEVSTPELDTLVELTRDLPGCLGARLTGAGFGGCTVNLVQKERSPDFIAELERGYQDRTGREAKVYLCYASQGATYQRTEV